MHDQLSDARSVRLLKVIDNFNREVLALGAIFLYRRIELGEHWTTHRMERKTGSYTV